MFDSPISKTQEQLVQAAREATTDYITNGTDLTEAVVKAASAIKPVTSEHVRRICEMTYHDAYERMFAEKTGMYQYVSFDPPDAIRAAEMLDALQLGLNNQANFDKLAGYRQKVTDAFSVYKDVVTGKNVNRASQAVEDAKKALNKNKRRLSELSESYKSTRDSLDQASTEYNKHIQDLNTLYKDRANLLRKLHITTKNNVRADKAPGLNRQSRRAIKKDPALKTQLDSLYGQSAIDSINASNQAIQEIQRNQKHLSGKLSDIKKAQKARAESGPNLKDTLHTAAGDLRTQKDRTIKYRIGTGAAVAVPAGIGIYAYGKNKERKNDPYRRFRAEQNKQASAKGLKGLQQMKQPIEKRANLRQRISDAASSVMGTLSGKNVREAEEALLKRKKSASDAFTDELDTLRETPYGKRLKADTSIDQLTDKGFLETEGGLTPTEATLFARDFNHLADTEGIAKAERDLAMLKNRQRFARGTAAALPLGVGVGAGVGMTRNQQPAQKTASMPRKFQRMNTHELWTKAASGRELQDHNPTRELQRVHRDLKDSISTVKSELYGAEQNEKLAMLDMVKQAKAGLSAGHSMEQVLHAAVSVVDASEPFMAKTAHDLCATIAQACGKHQNFSKTAAALQEVNPNHPIPQKFKKLAEANIQRKHLEVTLDELNRNLDYFNEKLVDELTR